MRVIRPIPANAGQSRWTYPRLVAEVNNAISFLTSETCVANGITPRNAGNAYPANAGHIAAKQER